MSVALESISDKMKRLREAKGFTKYRLAKLSGLRESYIGQLEAGRVNHPRRDTLVALAKGLGVSPSVFFEDKPEPESDIKSHPIGELIKEIQERYSALELVEIPIKGTIPGSYPFTIEKKPDSVSIVKELLGDEVRVGSLFALQVADDSYNNDGVFKGDTAIIDSSCKEPVKGKLYAVRANDTVTIRRAGKALNIKDSKILGRVILTGRWVKH